MAQWWESHQMVLIAGSPAAARTAFSGSGDSRAGDCKMKSSWKAGLQEWLHIPAVLLLPSQTLNSILKCKLSQVTTSHAGFHHISRFCIADQSNIAKMLDCVGAFFKTTSIAQVCNRHECYDIHTKEVHPNSSAFSTRQLRQLEMVISLVGHIAAHHRGQLCCDLIVVLGRYDVATKRRVRSFTGHLAPITDLSLSSDGRWLMSSSEDGTFRVWDIPSARVLQV